MSKIEKLLKKICNPAYKQNIKKQELETILNHFFEDQWTFGEISGSHNYRIYHPYFKNFPHKFGPEGFMTIPVSQGQYIKHFYVKVLCRYIKIIEELEK